MDLEVVGRMTLEAVLEHARIQVAVERREGVRHRVAPRRRARLDRLTRRGLGVRVVTRAALRAVGLFGGQVGQHRPHLVAAQALLRLRPQRRGDLSRGGGIRHRTREVVARGAVDGQVGHVPELHLRVLVTAALAARLVGGCEMVHTARVALDAVQPLQRRVIRLQVDPVPGGVGDDPPLLRVPLDMALGADLVGDVGVDPDRVRLLHDLGQPHLAALHDVRPVARLAAEPLVRALREPLERVAHQVALEAELVVVLDVVVRLVHEDGPHAQRRHDRHAQHHLDAGGQGEDPLDDIRKKCSQTHEPPNL